MRKGYSIYQDARYTKDNPLSATLAGARKRTTRNKLKDLESAVDALTIDVSNREYVAQFISDLERHAEENSYLRRTPNSNHQEQWRALSKKLRSKYTAFESFVEHPLTSTIDSLVSYEQPRRTAPVASEKTPVQKQVAEKKTLAAEFVNNPIINAMILAEDPHTRDDRIKSPESREWYAQRSAELRVLNDRVNAERTPEERAYAKRYTLSDKDPVKENIGRLAKNAGKVAAVLTAGLSLLFHSPVRTLPHSDRPLTRIVYETSSEDKVYDVPEASKEAAAFFARPDAPLVRSESPQSLLASDNVPISETSSLNETPNEQPLLRRDAPTHYLDWVPSAPFFPDGALARVDTTSHYVLTEPRARVVNASEPVEVRHEKLMSQVIKPRVVQWKATRPTESFAPRTPVYESPRVTRHPEALALDPVERAEQIRRQKEWLAHVVSKWKLSRN